MSDSENDDQDEPKIIVDTDWKEQVAREKETSKVAEGPSNQEDSATPDDGDDDDSTVDIRADDKSLGDNSDSEMPLPPPASFDVLISMLFTQAMALLGQMPAIYSTTRQSTWAGAEAATSASKSCCAWALL